MFVEYLVSRTEASDPKRRLESIPAPAPVAELVDAQG
jgi:hypothetical protein